jgi:hypothetical protein
LIDSVSEFHAIVLLFDDNPLKIIKLEHCKLNKILIVLNELSMMKLFFL